MNLPAIFTIEVGSKGHDLNLLAIVTISFGIRDMIDTACKEERSSWKGTEENVIKPTPQGVDSFFLLFLTLYIYTYIYCHRIFLEVGRLHPKTSLQIEMGLLPWKWEAKMRCIQFWHKVMTMGEERLVKRVAMEALSLKGKVKWLENLEQCLADFGWNDVRLDGFKGMSNAEVKHMIKNCAWREVTTRWAEELEERQSWVC